MSLFSSIGDIFKGAKNVLFGQSGSSSPETTQVTKWTPQQQQLFSQLYGTVTPNLGQGLAKTPEDLRYQQFLSNYPTWYSGLIRGVTDPTGVERAYAGQTDFLKKLYDPWQVGKEFSSLPGVISNLYSPTEVQNIYAGLPAKIKELYDPSKVESAYSGLPESIRSLYDPNQLTGLFDPSGINQLYSPDALKSYYQNVVYPEFEQTGQPRIESQFGGPGYWGEARARAVSDAYSNIGRQEASDLYGLDTERRGRLAALQEAERAAKLGMGEQERQALLSTDLSRRAELLGMSKEELQAQLSADLSKRTDLLNLAGQRREAQLSTDLARRNALLSIGQEGRQAQLSADLSRRADMLGLDQRGKDMLANLANILPVTEQTLSQWSRLFTPENSPYMQMALSMLQLQPFDTFAGMRQPTGGLVGNLLGGAGTGLGIWGGEQLAKLL